MDTIDLRDVAEAAADFEHDDHAEAVAIRAAFIKDGLANDVDSFAAYAEDEPVAISEYYFAEYAQELAEDHGAISGDEEWPLRCINWEWAARELLYDYSTFTVDGTDYHVRTL